MSRIITPTPYPVPAGIVTYTDPQDWRLRHVAGDIPSDPDTISRFWSDPSAQARSVEANPFAGFSHIFPPRPEADPIMSYLIPARHANGKYERCKIGSPMFYSCYGQSAAHGSMIQLIKEYAWVYELTGDPVVIKTLYLSPKEASTANFYAPIPNYPINLRSDFMFFTLRDELVCLPTEDFIEYFKPKSSSLSEKRATVAVLAQDKRLSDSAAISMIRLAIQETPSQILI